MTDILPLNASDAGSPERSDLELMERIAGGDAVALERLLRQHWAPLVRYSASILHSVDAAEDVVQETFVRVWDRRFGWHATGSVRAYLYQVTRRLALNERRRTRTRIKWRERMRAQESPQSPSPMRLLEVEERRKAVEQAIQELPKRRREVFVLAWFHRLSYQEIAQVLGISPNTVSNHMTAANADLCRRLGTVRDDEA